MLYRVIDDRYPARRSILGPVYANAMLGRLFHTLIEVIDPRTGRLLVSRRLPF